LDCLSSLAESVVPVIPAVPAPAKAPIPPLPGFAHAGLLDAVVDEVTGARTGIVGAGELGAMVLAMGNTLGSGTAGVELMPRLPISKDPSGIPVRAAPPGVVGDVDVGADEAARLLEPEPHAPDIPDVSGIPGAPEDIGIPDVADVVNGVAVPDVVVPESAAVAGAAVPTASPPPSKLAVDPNISDGEVPTVGHAVVLAGFGIVIVPVTPVGTGLRPAEVISVAPRGIPAGDAPEPEVTPSGDVAPTIGVGSTVPSNGVSTCATAALQANSVARTTAVARNLAGIVRSPTELRRRAPMSVIFATGSLAVTLSDIGQSLNRGEALGPSAAADVQFPVDGSFSFRCTAGSKIQSPAASGGDPVGRCHEFRSDRIPDGLRENPVDLRHRGIVDPPSHDVTDG
jgi:hypothetical protein